MDHRIRSPKAIATGALSFAAVAVLLVVSTHSIGTGQLFADFIHNKDAAYRGGKTLRTKIEIQNKRRALQASLLEEFSRDPEAFVGRIPKKERNFVFDAVVDGQTTMRVGRPADGGKWVRNPQLLENHAAVYSFGVGEDILFDTDMAGLFGCQVYLFDPNPAVVEKFPAPESGYPCGAGHPENPPFSLALEARCCGPELSFGFGGTPWALSPPPPASSPDPARDANLQPRPRRVRAWLELGGFLAYSVGDYWIGYKSHFPEDWQFKMTLDSQISRILFLEGWRFDSNNFKLNWTHSLAGVIYYQFSRTNHLSWAYSLMMSIVGSTFWELSEWKEVIALNDQIMTGFGGFAIGEPWYQVGHYLAHQSGLLFQALSFMNPILKLNHWLDRKDPRTRGYVPPGWKDFGLAAGVRRLSTAGLPAETAVYFAVHAQLIRLPEYGKAGDIREEFKDTYFSSMSLDYAARNGTADETRFSAEVVPWGYFRQRIDENLKGYSLIVGLGSSFEYFKKRPLDDYDINPVPVYQGFDLHLEIPRNFTDKLAIVHLAGPVLDWTVFRRGWKIRTVGAAHFDFGLINSYALNEYSQLHHTPPSDTIEGMKTTVFYYGYYYGFGGTLSGSTDLEWGALRARALASFGAWGSANSLDRFQYKVTNNARLADTRFRYLFSAGWKVPRAPFELFVTYEGVQRWGRLLEVRSMRLEKRLFAGLEFQF